MRYVKTLDEVQAPEWTMEDAYGDVQDPRYRAECRALRSRMSRLAHCVQSKPMDLCQAMLHYESAVTKHSSLAMFCKCCAAKDSTDDRVTRAQSVLDQRNLRLETLATPLLDALFALDDSDPLWQQEPLNHWHFVIRERKNAWENKMEPAARALYRAMVAGVFIPMGAIFKRLQKEVSYEAENQKGEMETVKAAKMVAIVKGAPDPVLRASNFAGMNAFYGKNGARYARVLNRMHAFRIAAFQQVGVSPLRVSLAQNRMSRQALMAMRRALLGEIETIRDSVRLRAPYFGVRKLAVYDLMAPAPSATASHDLIPYRRGIRIVQRALTQVDPAMGDFIGMMVKNHWVDAKYSDVKIGGAFYSRFNALRQPRVFSTYLGTITAVLQQSHEMGHALHYWFMRDLPMIETEFPMTLTETASTFNRAVVRQYLLQKTESVEDRFGMLWQELRSVANFMMNTMVRMDFELRFLEKKEKGLRVSDKECVAMMRRHWAHWYGDTTDGADDYLWAYKLHYYKTDQLIYNYPYTVGYLLSQGLMHEWATRGKDFFEFYQAMLRDTGRMTLDEVVRHHFGADATSVRFWRNCMKAPLSYVKLFEKEFAK